MGIGFAWSATLARGGASVVVADINAEIGDRAISEIHEQGGTRTFFRAVLDGQYKLVRWFSPTEYGNPATLEELYTTRNVGLYVRMATHRRMKRVKTEKGEVSPL